MSADLNKRIMVRVTEDQLAWIAAMAADEGMDNATFVRVVIDRLSKGRAPLIGMMSSASVLVVPQGSRLLPTPEVSDERQAPLGYGPTGDVGDLIAQRAAEAAAVLPEGEAPTEADAFDGAAIPLRRAPRSTLYNPGRS